MEDCESHEGNSRSTSIMAHLKNSLLSKLTELNPSLSIHSHHSSSIQRCLQRLFNTFDTPTHPPYALMIRRAITELNNGTGSSEEAIAEFIRREYEDLPLAHVKILRIHLRKLCHEGELACTDSGSYMVLFDGCDRMGDGEQIEQCKGRRKRKRKRSERRKGTVKNSEGVEGERDNGLQEEGIKKQVKVLELDGGSNNEPNRVVEWTREHGEEQEVEEEESQIQVQCASICSKCRHFV